MTTIDKQALKQRYAEERDKRLRPDGNAQYLRLTDQLARASHGYNAFPPVFLDADLGRAAEYHDHIVSVISLLYEPRAYDERPWERERPERLSLDRVQGPPEGDRAGGTRVGCPELRRMRFSGLVLSGTGIRGMPGVMWLEGLAVHSTRPRLPRHRPPV